MSHQAPVYPSFRRATVSVEPVPDLPVINFDPQRFQRCLQMAKEPVRGVVNLTPMPSVEDIREEINQEKVSCWASLVNGFFRLIDWIVSRFTSCFSTKPKDVPEIEREIQAPLMQDPIESLTQLLNQREVTREGLDRIEELRDKIPLKNRILLFFGIREFRLSRHEKNRGLLFSIDEKRQLLLDPEFEGEYFQSLEFSEEDRAYIQLGKILYINHLLGAHEIIRFVSEACQADEKYVGGREDHVEKLFKVLDFSHCLEKVYCPRNTLALQTAVSKEEDPLVLAPMLKAEILLLRHPRMLGYEKCRRLLLSEEALSVKDIPEMLNYFQRIRIFESLASFNEEDGLNIQSAFIRLFTVDERQTIIEDKASQYISDPQVSCRFISEIIPYEMRKNYLLTDGFYVRRNERLEKRDVISMFSDAELTRLWGEANECFLNERTDILAQLIQRGKLEQIVGIERANAISRERQEIFALLSYVSRMSQKTVTSLGTLITRGINGTIPGRKLIPTAYLMEGFDSGLLTQEHLVILLQPENIDDLSKRPHLRRRIFSITNSVLLRLATHVTQRAKEKPTRTRAALARTIDAFRKKLTEEQAVVILQQAMRETPSWEREADVEKYYQRNPLSKLVPAMRRYYELHHGLLN